jgi:radical SAM superfamily enzyme YgiQ (UPF0313 family)
MDAWSLKTEIRERVAREEGTLRRAARLPVALCYPSPYAVGMSSLGFQAIYRQIHLHPQASAERVFLPEEVVEFRRARLPLVAYESERPAGDFPVLAFSVAYELEVTGFLEMLDLAGLPLLRSERNAAHPLVIAGGPLTNSNPLPLAPFVDALLLGEAEELIGRVLDLILELPREPLLDALARLPGCYVPGRTPGLPAIARAPDALLPARSQIVTAGAVLSSMFLIEPERGCSRGCTYCVMRRTTNGGMRLVAPERVLELVPATARRVGLVGAAVTDHPKIRAIVRAVVDTGREIGISSLRADRLDAELVGLLARGGYRTLTTAADGASERLRSLVDRRTREAHLVRAAELAAGSGLRLKLYEMLGLPGEADADVDELVRFALELSRIVPLALGVAPFVAKRNTPLDGTPFAGIEVVEGRLRRLRAGLMGRVEVRPTSARWAWVEYMLSQGGEASGLAALDAWRAGATFGAWKRAFETRDARPFRSRPVPDGRRRAPTFETLAPLEA